MLERLVCSMGYWKALTAFLLAFGLMAQESKPASGAHLSGRVVDENNVPLAGAEVTLIHGSAEFRAFSDPTGAFELDLPATDDYFVQVALPGYFDLRDRSVQISAGRNELTLLLSRVRDNLESLDVSGTASVIDMDTSARDQRLTGAELLDIPYRNNNDLRNAMRILPGIVQDQNGGIHVNGAAEQNVLYTIDGFNLTDPLTGTFQTRLSVEAVQSMSVLSGPVPAQYGKGGAGVLAVNTEMGDDKFLYSATNFFPGVEYRQGLIIGSWTPRFNFSGPIRKGKAWFWDSLAADYSKNVVRGLPAGENQTSNWRLTNMLRAQVNLTPSNLIQGGFLVNEFRASNSGLSALDPVETTTNQRASEYFFDIKDQIYLGRGSLIEFGFASNHTNGREIPQGGDYLIYGPYSNSGNYFVDGKQTSSRNQWIANYFLPSFRWAGAHQIKMGLDLDRLGYWQNINRTGFVYYDVTGVPDREVTFAGSGLLSRTNFESAGYIDDSWRVRPGLLLELGLRTDRDQILKNWNVAPRAGFTWSPFHLEHTKISGGYGLIYAATNLVLFTRPDDQYPISTLYPEIGGLPFTSVSSYVINREHLATPRYQNLNLGWEQQLGKSYFTSVEAIGRWGQHGLSYFDSTGLASQTVYRLSAAERDQYTAFEFTVRHNIRRQYQWLASYIRSIARSNAVLDLTSDQPLIVGNNSGRLPWDTPNRIVTWGFLPTLWKNWSFAYLGEWHSGFPFTVQNARGFVIGGVDAYRYPNYFDLNLAVERQFGFRGQRWALRLGLDNVTNHINYDAVNNDVDSPQFLHYFGGQTRSVAFRIRWLGKL